VSPNLRVAPFCCSCFGSFNRLEKLLQSGFVGEFGGHSDGELEVEHGGDYEGIRVYENGLGSQVVAKELKGAVLIFAVGGTVGPTSRISDGRCIRLLAILR
jgi:hypothetical protein